MRIAIPMIGESVSRIGMTRHPRRQVNGVILLDKPVGWTSNAALQAVRRLYQAAKAGHTGSLDPLASGFCRFAWARPQDVQGSCSTLIKATSSLAGWASPATGDAEGEVIATHRLGC